LLVISIVDKASGGSDRRSGGIRCRPRRHAIVQKVLQRKITQDNFHQIWKNFHQIFMDDHKARDTSVTSDSRLEKNTRGDVPNLDTPKQKVPRCATVPGSSDRSGPIIRVAIAFQRQGNSQLEDFMNPRFLGLLESIELSLSLPDGRDVSAELVAVASRLNEWLPDDDDLKPVLYETIPE
jgi:hypothetical protein